MKKQYLFVFFVILTLNFFLPRLMPGDPFLELEVIDGNINTAFKEEHLAQYRANYDLDKPFVIQFSRYIGNLLHLNLGYSIYHNRGVSFLIIERLPWTLLIVTSSLLLSCSLGTMLGGFSVLKSHKKSDRWFYSCMVTLSEVPGFILGILFLIIFASKLKWFPLSGG